MKTNFKFYFLLICSFFIFSFDTTNDLKVELVNSNIDLKVNNINLEKGVYFLNKMELESLYVEVDSKRINGKRMNENGYQKDKIKGTKYIFNFVERLNNNEKIIARNKVFIIVWDNGEVDTWNTKPMVLIGNYEFNMKPIK